MKSVASAADAVYVAPGTRSPFVGLAAEYLFLGGLFEKLGVSLEYERIGKYKTAVDGLAGHEMSDANREMSEAILDSIQSQFLTDIAASRGIGREELQAIVDQAPASPAELEARRLIDGAAFLDEILDKEKNPPLVKADVYAQVPASARAIVPPPAPLPMMMTS